MKLGIQVLIFLTILLTAHFPGHCSESNSGGNAILNQPIGARQIGMGETFVGIANDINAAYYNPSGLTQIDKEIHLSYQQGLVNTYYASFGLGKKINSNSSLAINVDIFQAGSIEIPITETEYQTIRVQDDYLLLLSYARDIQNTNLAIGANIKLLQSTLLEQYKTNAYAADFGLLFHPGFIKDFHVGCAVQNIGTGLKYEYVSDPLPLTYRVGFAYRLPGKLSKLNVATDFVKLYSSPIGFNSGVEFNATNNLIFRAGYRVAESINYFSVGFGFYINGTKFDYSQTFETEFQSLYQTSLSFVPQNQSVSGNASGQPSHEKSKEITLQTPATSQIKVDDSLSSGVEEKLKPVFRLIEKGYYLKAQKELDVVLITNQEKKYWNITLDKLDLVVAITEELLEQDFALELTRKGLVSFLKPVENPKDALIKLRYAWENTKDENDKNIINKLYVMLENYYPEMAKVERIPEGLSMVNYKLFKALNNIYDGLYDSAIQESQEVLDLEPDNVLAMKRLGSALYCIGEAEKKPELVEKGREIWRRVLKLSPNDKEIKEFLEKP